MHENFTIQRSSMSFPIWSLKLNLKVEQIIVANTPLADKFFPFK
jgi:hypothetical protein